MPRPSAGRWSRWCDRWGASTSSSPRPGSFIGIPLEETTEAVWRPRARRRPDRHVPCGPGGHPRDACPGLREDRDDLVDLGDHRGAVSRPAESPDAGAAARVPPTRRPREVSSRSLAGWPKTWARAGSTSRSVAPGGVETEMTRGYAYSSRGPSDSANGAGGGRGRGRPLPGVARVELRDGPGAASRRRLGARMTDGDARAHHHRAPAPDRNGGLLRRLLHGVGGARPIARPPR